MERLTREAILAQTDLPREEVDVPEWGGRLLVQGLSGLERDALEASLLVGKGKSRTVNLSNLRAKLVARSVISDVGERLFSDADIEALGRTSAAALDRLYGVAQRLSGLSNEDAEELAGNSESGQSDASLSD